MKFQSVLDPDEQLLWTGKPPAGLIFRSQDFFLVPISLVWMAGVLYWLFSADALGAPPFFLIVGYVFVIAGVYFVIGRFFVDAFVRSRTEYALTTRRAIIYRGLAGSHFSSFPIEKHSQIEFSARPAGVGTIKFGLYDALHQRAGLGIWSGHRHPFVFERIKNAMSVYEQVRSIQNRAA